MGGTSGQSRGTDPRIGYPLCRSLVKYVLFLVKLPEFMYLSVFKFEYHRGSCKTMVGLKWMARLHETASIGIYLSLSMTSSVDSTESERGSHRVPGEFGPGAFTIDTVVYVSDLMMAKCYYWSLISGQSVRCLMTVFTTVKTGHGVSYALGAAGPFTTGTSTRCPIVTKRSRTGAL